MPLLLDFIGIIFASYVNFTLKFRPELIILKLFKSVSFCICSAYSLYHAYTPKRSAEFCKKNFTINILVKITRKYSHLRWKRGRLSAEENYKNVATN
jgi:hypothetical protein